MPLLMRPLPDDATARTSPVVRPPVPSFNAPPPPPAAAAPPLPVVARPEAEEMRALAGKAPEEVRRVGKRGVWDGGACSGVRFCVHNARAHARAHTRTRAHPHMYAHTHTHTHTHTHRR